MIFIISDASDPPSVYSICDTIWSIETKVGICDAIKQNESKSRKNETCCFQCSCMGHIQGYTWLKTPSKLTLWFQRYSRFSGAQNNKIQKKINTIIGCILKSILASYNSFCLITSHISELRYRYRH